MKTLTGIPASPGIAIGKSLVICETKQEIRQVTIQDLEQERSRFHAARQKGIRQIDVLYEKTIQSIGREEAEVFQAHKMMMDDIELIQAVEDYMEREQCNVEYALHQEAKSFISLFEQMDNDYMKERAVDLRDIEVRLQKILADISEEDLGNIQEPVILVAKDLTPSQTAQMDTSKVLGFITELGGKTSHTAIFARALGIPAIVGVGNQLTELITSSQQIAIDGGTGHVFIEPSHEQLHSLQDKIEAYKTYKNLINQVKGKSAETKDGCTIELAGNIGRPEESKYILENEGEGIGLFRTEFLYMSSKELPTEEEQFQAYKSVAQTMKGKPVIIRTLDIGGDKQLDYLELSTEMNPFLGVRAIRLCLEQKELFKTQLRAILRASIYGDLKIMFPMICSMEELYQAKAILQEAKTSLESQSIPFNRTIQVGMMIETPAAAISANLFIREVDFFSIGSNDLVQYTLAVDRMNEHLSELYSPYHPAILRLIQNVVEETKKAGKWVGICGEAASDPLLIPVWLYMGVDELSMSCNAILEAKWLVRSIANNQLAEEIDAILSLHSADKIKKALHQLNQTLMLPVISTS